jgi:hypothetical protein
MDLTKIFTRNIKIVYREEDDGAFLFNPDTGDLQYMNQSGRETFLMVNGDNDIEQVLNHMLHIYPEVEPAKIQDDVIDFLENLKESQFILPLSGK